MKAFKVFVLAAVIFLSGCSKTSLKEDEKTKNIITSFYPVYSIAKYISKGSKAEVYNLTKDHSGCIHNYQLTVEDMKLFLKADMFIINGAGMEDTVLERAVSGNKDMILIDSSKETVILGPEDNANAFIQKKTGKKDKEHTHLRLGMNSHIWLSLENALIQAENIKNALVGIMPEESEELNLNFERFKKEIETLKERLDKINVSDIKAGSLHPGFEYIAKDMKITLLFSADMDEEGCLTPAGLAKLIRAVKDEGINYVFAFNGESAEAGEALSKETGIKLIVLDPVTSEESGGYITAMQKNICLMEESLK